MGELRARDAHTPHLWGHIASGIEPYLCLDAGSTRTPTTSIASLIGFRVLHKLKARCVAALSAALLVAVGLSACSPLAADAGVVRQLDEEVAGWDLNSAGEVVVQCSESVALGAQYHYTLVLRGDDSWNEVQRRLGEAGFEPTLAQDGEYGRIDLERRDRDRIWSVAVTLLQTPVDGTSCNGAATAEVGDTIVDLGTTIAAR